MLDGIAEGYGLLFFCFCLVIGANVLEFFEGIQEVLVLFDGQYGRYFFTRVVGYIGRGEHSGYNLRKLVRIGLASLGIADIGVDKVKEH